MPLSDIASKQLSEYLCDFIETSLTPYHVVGSAFDIVTRPLTRSCRCPITVLFETDSTWKMEADKAYYVERSGSCAALIKFPENITDSPRFSIVAAHTDSPCLRLKPDPVIESCGYALLNVETYGGLVKPAWFDRPLTVAGCVMVASEDGHIRTTEICLPEIATIPSLAPHLDHDLDRTHPSVQIEMRPVLGKWEDKDMFMNKVAKAAGCQTSDIVAFDLMCVPADPASIIGINEDIVSATHLDDQASVFTATWALSALDKPSDGNIAVLFLLDNEEVGSRTSCGADSTFVSDVLERICLALGQDRAGYMATLARSFMISADNAHAIHPNYPGKSDPVNRPPLGGGIALKQCASRKYCTTPDSAARFIKMCSNADVPVVYYANNSDIIGGSTLGNILLSHASMPAVDIGIPQLAMHSARECCHIDDVKSATRMFAEFFENGA